MRAIRLDDAGAACEVLERAPGGGWLAAGAQLHLLCSLDVFEVWALSDVDTPFEEYLRAALPPPLDERLLPAVTYWRWPGRADLDEVAWRARLAELSQLPASGASVQHVMSAALATAAGPAEPAEECDDQSSESESASGEEDAESDDADLDEEEDADEDFDAVNEVVGVQ
tara:strand:- start:4 stop:513 length:510 start_codon:yes stop_codon:yes gene_type:complete